MDKLEFSDQHDKEITQSEERLLALMKATSDVIYRMSPDWKTMTKLYVRGYPEDTEDSDPQWIDKYILPEDQSFVLGVIDDCIRDRRIFELEHRILKADGNIGWMYSHAIPLLDEKGDIKEWFGVASDITNRRKTEEALRESEKKYRTMIETAGEGIVMAKPHGSFYFVNRRMADMLGYSIEEILGKSSSDFVYPNWHPQLYELQNGDYQTGELKFIRKDGSELWTRYNAMPMSSDEGDYITNFAMYTDITEQKKAAEAVKISEANFRAIFECSQIGIAAGDMEGHILLSNYAFASMLGSAWKS